MIEIPLFLCLIYLSLSLLLVSQLVLNYHKLIPFETDLFFFEGMV